MEQYLSSLTELKTCYEKYTYDNIMSLDNKSIKYLCSEERKKVIQNLYSENMLAHNLIKERIKIMHEKEAENIQKRREFLDKTFA